MPEPAFHAGPPRRAFRTVRLALALLALTAVVAVGIDPARAQDEGSAAPEADPFNFAFSHYMGSGYYNVGGRQTLIFAFIPKYTIRKPEEHRFGMTLRFGFSIGFFDTRIEDLLDLGIPSRASTLAIVPGIEFPVLINKKWVLTPLLDVGVTWNSSVDGVVGMGAVGIHSRAVFETAPVDYVLYNRLLYARNGQTGTILKDIEVDIPSSSFTQLRTELDVRRLGGTHHIGQRAYDFALYVRNDFYPSQIEIPRVLEESQLVRNRWQLGFTWGPLDEWRPWWKVKMPRLGLAALFGDGGNGWRLIVRFRY